eukprot:CAMPEP_0194478540 /NCGR_PEP_ID=MMETSP0253-20130528/1954_1 /TAXON_ID=2966 /ORGANISM="Noctiluca scintillans" /LENGTH=183 /DNA_ID=CAMNT_0039317641 /DNA_START=42 /DNA_END=593 /DNA_ORIENTATION=+
MTGSVFCTMTNNMKRLPISVTRKAKCGASKSPVDDKTGALSVSVLGFEMGYGDKFAVYSMRVSKGNTAWVSKRDYSEFCDLHTRLWATGVRVLRGPSSFSAPPYELDDLAVDVFHMGQQTQLQEYLDRLLAIHDNLAEAEEVLFNFLDVPVARSRTDSLTSSLTSVPEEGELVEALFLESGSF